MDEKLVPVSEGIEDFKVNTPMEIFLVKQFLENGDIRATSKRSLRRLKADLKETGYRLKDHNKYEFFFGKTPEGYGNDFRHIYIKPLNDWFSYI